MANEYNWRKASALSGSAAPGQQIVFIEGNVPDAQLLAAAVEPGVQAVILNPNEDGVQQIADYLASHDISNLAAIDIVAHGSDGALKLGDTVLDTGTIPQYEGDLAAIGAALRPGGAIQLYGCDVAQDAAGVAFLQQLSDATGGASIAAASHLVGAASGGGSWTLNIDVGTVDVAAPFTANTLADYQGELASPTGDLWIGSWHSLIAGNLNQIDAVNVSGPTVLGTTDVANGLDSGDLALNHPSSLAVDPARDELFVVNAGFTIYAVPATTGGALTQIYAAPDTNPNEATGYIGDIVADETSDSLYFTQSDYNLDTNAQIPSDTGVYSINENGGATTQLVYDITGGETLYNPTSLGLDLSHNLAFFIENDAYAGGTGKVELEVGTLARHNYEDLLQIGDFATGFEINTGLVVDPVNQEIYYSIENYYTASENGIYSVHYTLSGSLASVGPVTTLYSGAAAKDPELIAIDPANGLLYVSGEVPLGSGETGAAWVGSLSGSAVAPLTQIFQLSTDTSNNTDTFADTTIFEAAPNISAGATVTLSKGDAPVTLDPTVTVTDESEPDLAGATVSIGGGFLSGDTLNFTNQNGISGAYDGSAGTLTLSGIANVADYQAALQSVTYGFSGDPTDGGSDTSRTIDWTVTDGVLNSAVATSTVDVAPCYCPGTLIKTKRGQKLVEKLKIGDEVMTGSGAARPIKWIGRRSYSGRFVMGRKDILPVCIKAGALDNHMPKRDLWISPNHAMYFDSTNGGVLIEARDLVNGVSVIQAGEIERVDYFHIELESHDVILAEGAWSETFVDDDSRGMFHNAHEYRRLYAEEHVAPARYFAPRVDEGYELHAIRQQIALRAGLATENEATPGALRGFIDRITPHSIEGWAQNADLPEAPVCLDIFAGGKLIGQVLANRYRKDLEQAGRGSGCNSFRFAVPGGVVLTPDSVAVKRSLDGKVLPQSAQAKRVRKSIAV